MEINLHLSGPITVHVEGAEQLSGEDERAMQRVLQQSAAIARKLERLDAKTPKVA